MTTLPIKIHQEQIIKFCKHYHIRKLSLFGSVLREDFTQQSDVDFLVEFEPDKTPSFFTLVHMEHELSDLIDGRKIDLRTPQELSHYFRDKVIQEAKVIYDLC